MLLFKFSNAEYSIAGFFYENVLCKNESLNAYMLKV